MNRLFGSALKTLGFLTILLAIPTTILFGGWAIVLVLYIIGVGLILYGADYLINYLVKNRKVFWRVQFSLGTIYLLLCIWTYMEWQEHNKIIFPKGFHGQAGIIFGVDKYPELPETKLWKRTIYIPENGVIITSTKEEDMVNQIKVSFADNSSVDYTDFDWNANFEIDCITSDSQIKSWLFKIGEGCHCTFVRIDIVNHS